MRRILIVYSTRQGQTEKIAQFLASEFERQGYGTEVQCARTIAEDIRVQDFNAVVIGGSVHASGFPRELSHWIRRNRKELATRPTAFFSVCLGILQQDAAVQKEEERIVQTLFAKTGWSPLRWTIFAGALPYSKYNWILKRIMRGISRRAGVETDMSKDYEYTDWSEVRTFANDCLATFEFEDRTMRAAVEEMTSPSLEA